MHSLKDFFKPGMLLLMVKSASNLKDKDAFGKSDPYLVCRMAAAPQVATTKVIQNDLNPVWNENLHLNVRTSPPHAIISTGLASAS